MVGPHKRLIKAPHPVAERGPEEIGVVVSVPSLQRKWGCFTVGRLLVHPLEHDGVQKKLNGHGLKNSESLRQAVRREATRRVAGGRVH
jgi:hypothetical protein